MKNLSRNKPENTIKPSPPLILLTKGNENSLKIQAEEKTSLKKNILGRLGILTGFSQSQ